MPRNLEPPDSHHLNAAQGWLELGNHIEAGGELDKIQPAFRETMDVLDIRWQVSVKSGDPDACREIAQKLRTFYPMSSLGWIRTAQNFYHEKRYEEAYAALAPALTEFPDTWVVQYDLACYACLLKRLEEARSLLKSVFDLDESKEARKMALRDPDLETLWPEITTL